MVTVVARLGTGGVEVDCWGAGAGDVGDGGAMVTVVAGLGAGGVGDVGGGGTMVMVVAGLGAGGREVLIGVGVGEELETAVMLVGLETMDPQPPSLGQHIHSDTLPRSSWQVWPGGQGLQVYPTGQ